MRHPRIWTVALSALALAVAACVCAPGPAIGGVFSNVEQELEEPPTPDQQPDDDAPSSRRFELPDYVNDYSDYPQGIDADGAPTIGPSGAPVQMTEFSDFACPHCATFSETVHQLIDTYVADGTLQITYRPMSFVNPNTSATAAAAGLCAAEQGAFWEMHDAIFYLGERRGSNNFTPDRLGGLADDIGLDRALFDACLGGDEKLALVDSLQEDAYNLGVSATPTVMLNGELLEAGAWSYDELEQRILDAMDAPA